MTKKRLSLAIVLTLLAGLICASAVYAAGLQETEVEASTEAEAGTEVEANAGVTADTSVDVSADANATIDAAADASATIDATADASADASATIDASADVLANAKVRNEAWDALTEAQKNELYAAKEAVDAAQKALYDKAAAMGLIDEETAEAMKASTDENTARMKSRGQSPIFGFRIKGNLSELSSEDFPLTQRGSGGSFFKGDGENADGFEFDKEEWLQQAVSEGKLTQEEADRMRERFESLSEKFNGRLSEKIKERSNKE